MSSRVAVVLQGEQDVRRGCGRTKKRLYLGRGPEQSTVDQMNGVLRVPREGWEARLAVPDMLCERNAASRAWMRQVPVVLGRRARVRVCMYVCGVVTGGDAGGEDHWLAQTQSNREREREKQLGYGRFGIREVRPEAKRREDVAVGVAEV